MPSSRFYEENEADEILRRAVGNSVTSGEMTRERLVKIAAEMGISEDELDRAEQQLAQQREEDLKAKEEAKLFEQYRQHRRQHLLSSLGGWMSTSVVLVGIDLITTHGITWSIWPVGIWGLFEVGHLIEGLVSPASRGVDFERWQRKRERRAKMRDRS